MYLGHLLDSLLDINSVTVCQEACLDYDEGLGCKYFAYDASKAKCQLLSSSEKMCDLIRGPPTPSLKDCTGKQRL